MVCSGVRSGPLLAAGLSDEAGAAGGCGLLAWLCSVPGAIPARAMTAQMAVALYLDIPFFLQSSVNVGGFVAKRRCNALIRKGEVTIAWAYQVVNVTGVSNLAAARLQTSAEAEEYTPPPLASAAFVRR